MVSEPVAHSRCSLKLTGLYWRASKNTERIEIRRHPHLLARIAAAFDGFVILQISDLHVDMNPAAMRRLAELFRRLSYDLCVLTGDYRGKTYGPCEATIEGMARARASRGSVYAVLGNHDSIRMVPALEEMGINMLINEVRTVCAAAKPLSGRHRRRALLPDGQHRKGRLAKSPLTAFRSFCRTRRRFIVRRRMPIST